MLREWRRSTIPRKHKNDLKLSSLYERYTGHSINNHHSAMEDACAVKRVVQVSALFLLIIISSLSLSLSVYMGGDLVP